MLQFEERETRDQSGGGTVDRLPLLLPDAGRVKGKAWLNEETGEILKTEVHMSLATPSASTTVFAKDARLALQVPQEMHASWGNVTGVARYSNYRRFEVNARIK